MIIVVAFQILNTVNNNNYQADNEQARKQATLDRQSLRNLVHNNDVYARQLGTYLTTLIQNSTNQTNTLLNFLVDNFGENSGYIERENFQYQQANDTFAFLKVGINNQGESLKNQEQILKNQAIIIKLLQNRTSG